MRVRSGRCNRRAVFLDEAPWSASKRSKGDVAFELFLSGTALVVVTALVVFIAAVAVIAAVSVVRGGI